MTALSLSVEPRHWRLREPFVISRSVQTQVDSIVVTLSDVTGCRGRGEGCGVDYAGETPAGMTDQIERARGAIQAGITRAALATLLPPGGARFALDSALWDLDAKRSGTSPFEQVYACPPRPVETAYTIGIRTADGVEAAARERARYPLLKLKVDARDPIATIAAARRGAPGARFIVDPNQSWSVDQLKTLAPQLGSLGVVLLEQPIKVGEEAGLDGYACPIQLCADELINEPADLAKAKGRFDVVNIKLDKAGGLTTGLALAAAARAAGFELMVGCMVGSSLAMAPAMVLAQQCAFVDLDGPLLLAEDEPIGLSYQDGVVQPPPPELWG